MWSVAWVVLLAAGAAPPEPCDCVERWLATFAGSDEEVRVAAVSALGTDGMCRASAALVDAVLTETPRVRGALLLGAGGLGPDGAPLVPFLHDRVMAGGADGDAALIALGAIGPAAVGALIDLLPEDPTAGVRTGAYRASVLSELGRAGRSRSEAVAAVAAVLDGAEPQLRRAAVGTLDSVEPDREQRLRRARALFDDRDGEVRAMAAAIVGGHAREALAAGASPAERAALVPLLLRALAADARHEYGSVFQALAALGPAAAAALPALEALARLPEDDRPDLALEAIAAIRGETAPTEQRESLLHRVIGCPGAEPPPLGAHALVEPLLALLDGPCTSLRVPAARLLPRLDAPSRIRPRVAPALAAALATGDADLRWAAARALSEVGASAAEVPGLVGALADPVPAVRREVVEALRASLPEAGSGATIRPALLAALGDPAAEVRAAAARALGVAGPSAAVVDPLVRALGDPDVGVRCLALDALATLGDGAAPAAMAVVGRLRDRERSVVETALAALGGAAFRRADVEAAVAALLRSEIAVEREAAAIALERLEARASLPALASLARDQDELVRLAVAHAREVLDGRDDPGAAAEAGED